MRKTLKIALISLLCIVSMPALSEQDSSDQIIKCKDQYYTCKDKYAFIEEECNKCPEWRKFINGHCLFIQSPYPDKPLIANGVDLKSCQDQVSAKPQFPWKNKKRYGFHKRSHDLDYADDEYSFYACDFLDLVFTTKENCDLCPNRQYVDERCILKESK